MVIHDFVHIVFRSLSILKTHAAMLRDKFIGVLFFLRRMLMTSYDVILAAMT
jgi:hypothetical protein